MKSFSKQNSKLIIHTKPDKNQSKLTVCIVKTLEIIGLTPKFEGYVTWDNNILN